MINSPKVTLLWTSIHLFANNSICFSKTYLLFNLKLKLIRSTYRAKELKALLLDTNDSLN